MPPTIEQLRRHALARSLFAPVPLETAVKRLGYVQGREKLDGEIRDRVYLFAPFDPVVWDRRRFRLFWNWDYRFEAYAPPAKRKLGYYALPLLWRDEVIGWANLQVDRGRLHVKTGFVRGKPTQKRFARALDAELARMRRFLGLAY